MSEGEEQLRAWMLQYQGGSLEAFQCVYAHLAPDLRRFLCHLLRSPDGADDLLQDTFLHLHRSRASYNPAYTVRPWLFGLARNVFLMNRRATRRWTAIHMSRPELPECAVLPGIDIVSGEEIRHRLAGLSPDQAEVLLLRHEWGFSFEEIAGILGVSASAARARASRGVAELRVAMNDLQRVRT